MSNYSADSKSQLAKLMATENISVQHQKISTAYFDPKNRILVCPIWKDMSGELYDLLMGHEVGHALDTPAEGWHDAVTTENKGRGYKGFLNVVEDARIEKRQKRRYPGLRRSFIKGYQELLDRNFFGIDGKDVNELPFIDRLNLYTKGGVMLGIEFTDAEKVMLSKVEACETWDDVLRVTNEIYEYSKEEQQEIQQQMFTPDENGEDEDFEDYLDEDDEGGNETDSEEETQDKESEDDAESQQTQSKSDAEEGDTESDEDFDQSADNINREKESKADSNFEPVCETDEEFRKNETQLLDKKSKSYLYVNLPKPILKNIITPVKRVQELMSIHFTRESNIQEMNTAVKDFKTKNERYIGLLAKEFEMRKAAKSHAKKKVSETGDIDIGKIYKYNLDDNIFRKMTTIPNGKSHGMVLLLDRSGSMQNNMSGSIEQILILSLFCRKVNIPFVVYGFGNNIDGRLMDFPEESGSYPYPESFEKTPNTVDMDRTYLREYLNSRMSTKEFNEAIRNLVMLKRAFSNGYRSQFLIPPVEHLSNTPLNESLVALKPIIENFRKVNNVDIMNLVLVHDGDADKNNRYMNEQNDYAFFNLHGENVVIRDPNSKYQFELEHNETYVGEQMRSGLMNWLKYTTGVRTFGFFICDANSNGMKTAICNRYVKKDGKTLFDGLDRYQRHNIKSSDAVVDLAKKLRTEKFLESHISGYNTFYLIPGGNDLSIENEELDVADNASISKIKTAFQKHNKKRQINRVLVSKFITNIAVEKVA